MFIERSHFSIIIHRVDVVVLTIVMRLRYVFSFLLKNIVRCNIY
jgi:hypothetical protein